MGEEKQRVGRGRGLTSAGREALRRAAQVNQPWRHSTGPRTPEGKRRSSRNATKHGKTYWLRFVGAELARLSRTIRNLDDDEVRAQVRELVQQEMHRGHDAGGPPEALTQRRAMPPGPGHELRSSAK